jgi:uncharacterized protein
MKKQWNRIKYVLGLCVLLLFLFRVIYVFRFIFYIVFELPYDNVFANIAEIVIHTAVFMVVLAVGLKDQRKTLASVCFFKKVNPKVWGAAIVCSIGFTFFYYYFHFLFVSFKYDWNPNLGASEGSLWYNIIDVALVPAVVEELLFKGLIFTILKKHYPVIVAIIIASFMFAAVHLSFIRIIPLFLVSCYSFWLYLRSGSLILPMLLHFINNLFTLVLISEPFAYIGTFYSALAMWIIGSYFLYKYSKAEQKAVNHNPPGRC